MKARALLVVAAALTVGCAPYRVIAQPQVPEGYTVEEYVSIPGAGNPLGLGFSPAGSRFWGGQLFVCFGSDGSGAENRAVYRVPEKGKAVRIGTPPDIHAALAVPPPGSAFPDRLYGPMGNQVVSYDSGNTMSKFADVGRTELYAMRFGPGGRWGRDIYLLDNCGSRGTLHRYQSNGAVTKVVTGLPFHAMGFDFGPGGPWGDCIYLGLSGSGIFRLDPNGVLSPFVLARDMPPAGWLAGHAFDTAGEFGGKFFYSSLGDSRLMQVDPNGVIAEFASGFNFGPLNQSSGRLAFGPDHALYVSDGLNNVVWRISRNRLGLRRDAAVDTAITASGETHRGTLASERFVLETSFGKVDLKAANVVGMAAADGGAVLCLLADGQVVRGKLAGDPVRILLPGEERKTVSVDAFRQWSRRVCSDYPVSVRPAGGLLVLRDGQELLVDANGANLDLRTRLGTVHLNCADVVDLSAVGPGGAAGGPEAGRPPRFHRVRLASGSVLTGVLQGGKVSVAAKLWSRLEAPADQVVQLRTGRSEDPSPWWTRVELADGDTLVGSPVQGALRVRTQAGMVEVPMQEVREFAAVLAVPGSIRLCLWDGNTVAGLVEKDEFRFALRHGPEVRVPADQVVQFTCPIRGSAEDFAKRLTQLVARLGADRYQDREAATKELIELGPVIAPFLESFRDHSDPEVRQRVATILDRLRGGSPAPPTGD